MLDVISISVLAAYLAIIIGAMLCMKRTLDREAGVELAQKNITTTKEKLFRVKCTMRFEDLPIEVACELNVEAAGKEEALLTAQLVLAQRARESSRDRLRHDYCNFSAVEIPEKVS